MSIWAQQNFRKPQCTIGPEIKTERVKFAPYHLMNRRRDSISPVDGSFTEHDYHYTFFDGNMSVNLDIPSREPLTEIPQNTKYTVSSNSNSSKAVSPDESYEILQRSSSTSRPPSGSGSFDNDGNFTGYNYQQKPLNINANSPIQIPNVISQSDVDNYR